MTPLSFAPAHRRLFWMTTAAVLASLCGQAEIGRADELDAEPICASVSVFSQSPSMGTDVSGSDAPLLSQSIWGSGPVISRLSGPGANYSDSSSIRLVSLDTSPEAVATTYEAGTVEAPIYTMQPAELHQADGNVYTGPSQTTGTWVLVAPYGWIAGVNGQIAAGNRVVNVDITPGQVLSHLGDVDGALMLHAEVGRGDWGLILDGNLIRASTSVSTVPALVDVTLQQTLLETLGMYRLVEASDYIVEGKSVTLDLLAGGRYYQFLNDLTVHPFDPALPTVPVEASSTWVDLVIGGRTRVPVTTSIDAFARADVGGFGIGSSSTLAWNIIAGLDWKMTSCSSLVLGYREMNINRYSGSGLVPFGINAKMYGPFMAIAFQF